MLKNNDKCKKEILWSEYNDVLFFMFKSEWKKILAIQLIGYILAIVLSPITICIFERKFPDGGRSWTTFPIISFIVWIMLIVLPAVCAYIKKIEHRNICLMVLWIPLAMVFFLCFVVLGIAVISLLYWNKTRGIRQSSNPSLVQCLLILSGISSMLGEVGGKVMSAGEFLWSGSQLPDYLYSVPWTTEGIILLNRGIFTIVFCV